MRAFRIVLVAGLAAALDACAGPTLAGDSAPRLALEKNRVLASAPAWTPQPSDTFQWDLSDTPAKIVYPASVYDIDMFDNGASIVHQLHSLGRHVVCYISVGSYEDWRPDAYKFKQHPEVIGEKYPGWPGEWFIDIRDLSVLGPIMNARFDLCKSKGFDAVEPDNVDTYQADTGFMLTAKDQIAYDTWVANQAHARGLAVALKNDDGQAGALEPSFDFALEEECVYYTFCNNVQVFHAAGKAVFDVEYTQHTSSQKFYAADCPSLAAFGYTGILKRLNLGAWIEACRK